jgi:2-polyprenyl-6-methoxyphenol hydroxylase-like FAD-dependent oxidoreductase
MPVRRCRLLVGADGVRSAVRACMLPDSPPPRYLVSAWPLAARLNARGPWGQ